MTNEELVKVVQRAEQSALLLGQITGQLHLIMSACQCADSKHKLETLFSHVLQTVHKIFYEPIAQEEKKNEDVHGRGTEESFQVL